MCKSNNVADNLLVDLAYPFIFKEELTISEDPLPSKEHLEMSQEDFLSEEETQDLVIEEGSQEKAFES